MEWTVQKCYICLLKAYSYHAWRARVDLYFLAPTQIGLSSASTSFFILSPTALDLPEEMSSSKVSTSPALPRNQMLVARYRFGGHEPVTDSRCLYVTGAFRVPSFSFREQAHAV